MEFRDGLFDHYVTSFLLFSSLTEYVKPPADVSKEVLVPRNRYSIPDSYPKPLI